MFFRFPQPHESWKTIHISDMYILALSSYSSTLVPDTLIPSSQRCQKARGCCDELIPHIAFGHHGGPCRVYQQRWGVCLCTRYSCRGMLPWARTIPCSTHFTVRSKILASPFWYCSPRNVLASAQLLARAIQSIIWVVEMHVLLWVPHENE